MSDVPSGLPSEDSPEADPLGPPETDPDGEEAADMPGIPDEGEPPAAS